MNSPFPYDTLSTNEQFFGRGDELKRVAKIVQYSNNLLIHSKRRMGKSSLIKYFLDSHQDGYLCLYVDIFDITSKEDFAKALLKALSNAQKIDIRSALKNLTSSFKRVRVEPSIDTKTLEYSIKPIVATLSFAEMMDDFFYTLEQLSKKQKIILAIDEFQQIDTIKDVKLDSFLRTYIQQRKNISFLFAGSKRHLLTSLFAYKAPLYELATHFELQPLQIEDISDYSSRFLNIDRALISCIYEKSDGETKLIQHILHLLYVQKGGAVSIIQIDEALKEIINSKDSSYKIVFDTLNNNQKTALKIVGKYKKGFFAGTVLNEYAIKKQTLQSSVEALFKKELIDKQGDCYFIPDRTFELWVERLVGV